MKTSIKILIIVLFPLILISCGTKSADNVILDVTHPDLPILHLNGTPFENGMQHGKLLRKEINELIGFWKQDLEEKYQIPADTFVKLFLDSTNYIPAIKKWTPELLDEVKGISKGSGVDFNTLFAFQLTDEIWTNTRLIDMPHHCTTVGINNYKKDGGLNYIAQNIDVTPFYHGFEVILDIKDNNSDSRKLVTTFAGYIGANGLNKHIGITCNSLMDLKSSLNGLPVSFVVRGVLEKNTFKEAKRFIKEIKHASGQNYIIGSKKYISSLECSSDLVVEYWPDSTKNYTYHANRSIINKSYHPSYLKYINTVFNTTPDAINFGDPRLKSIESKILENDSIDLTTIKNALIEKPVCNINTWVSTIMVFNDNYNELRITPGKPNLKEFIVISMKN